MRAKRTDLNQKEIVEQLRSIGASVYITSGLGHDFPDIVVGFRNRNYLFEIKSGHPKHALAKLRPGQLKFMQHWHGQANVITSFDEAMAIMAENDTIKL